MTRIDVGDRVRHEHGTTIGTVVRHVEWGSTVKRFEVVYDNGLRATVSASNLRLVEKRKP